MAMVYNISSVLIGFRPYEELYNIENDPCCLDNCIEKPEYKVYCQS